MDRPLFARLATLAAVLAAALALAACGAAGDAPAPDDPGTPETVTPEQVLAAAGLGHGAPQGQRAPDLRGVTGWHNGDPLSIAELTAQGRVVLVDFWTYTCVNCIRTLPFLRDWHAKYAEHGLTIIGVHTPEFAFEEDPEHVADAIARHGLAYAVAQDNDYATWDAYQNRYWPAKYLVDASGTIRYAHYGEGAYEETELQIRLALLDAGADLEGIPVGGVDPQVRDPRVGRQTRELYGGYARNYHPAGNYAGQDAYYAGPDMLQIYRDPGTYERDRWYLEGAWRNERDAIVHARDTAGLEDYLVFPFTARSVNVVMEPWEGRGYDVVVEIDGRPLLPDEAGPDVAFDGEGRSVVRVDAPRMYEIVALPEAGTRTLRLASNAHGFAMYAVTFGAYTEGP